MYVYATEYGGQRAILGVVSFHHVGPNYWTQFVSLVDKHLTHQAILLVGYLIFIVDRDLLYS